MSSCIIATACAVTFLVCLTVRPDASHALTAVTESGSAKLAFTSNEKGEYAFDTGTLRGKLQQAGKSLGLSSVVHAPSGIRLDDRFGILSYYRVFTTNKRYGHAAWDWPCESKLLPDGAVQIVWPASDDRPFEITAAYRWTGKSTLDLQTAVKAEKDLGNFEIFLASYFQQGFPSPYVYVGRNPEADGKPGFLLAKRSYGDWQLFPRDEAVLEVVHDGRWQKEPNPVKWVIMPRFAARVCLRRGAGNDLAVVLMSPPGDCFAIATPYEGESHYSLYLSLFGHDIKAGKTAKAHARFVVTAAASDRQILDLYHKYIEDLEDWSTWLVDR